MGGGDGRKSVTTNLPVPSGGRAGESETGEVMMYKKQMTAQKVICLLSIIASVVTFVYALGLMTDLYDSLYPVTDRYVTMAQKQVYKSLPKGEPYPETGFGIYKEMQPFNSQLLLASIGLILLSCLLYITNTATRRKYYIGNIVSSALAAAGNVAVALWAHGQVMAFKAQYVNIDVEVLQWVLDKLKKPCVVSNFWFDAHYFVLALSILVAVLLILNVIWKLSLMKQEKQLLEAGKAVSA